MSCSISAQLSGAALPPGETLEVDLAILPVLKQNKVLSGHSSKSMWPFSKHVSIMLYHDPCSKTCKRILPIESQGQAPTCFMRGFEFYLPACQSMPNPCTDCVISQVFVGRMKLLRQSPHTSANPDLFFRFFSRKIETVICQDHWWVQTGDRRIG